MPKDVVVERKTSLGTKVDKEKAIQKFRSTLAEVTEAGKHTSADKTSLREWKAVESFAKALAAGLITYFLGYFGWSLLYVILPFVAFAIYKNRKDVKMDKALLHRELAVMGEERFLRSTLKEQLPSWLTFPDVERVEWINSIVAAIWPHVGLYADKVLREVVEPMAIEALEDYKLWGFSFERVHLGQISPRVTGVRVYARTSDESTLTKEITLDLDLEYGGDAEVVISLMSLPASVSNLQLMGRVRVVLKPLIDDIPIIGGIQIMFLRQPELDFDLGGAGNLLEVPGLNGLMKAAIHDQIAAHLILPNRVAVALTDKVSTEELRIPKPSGLLVITVVEARDLLQTDARFTSIEPYVVFKQGVREKRTSVAKGTNPKWEETIELPFEAPETEGLRLTVMEKDTFTTDDFLGNARLTLAPVVSAGAVDSWLDLDGVDKGQIRLKLSWWPVSTDAGEVGEGQVKALLSVYVEGCRLTTSLSRPVKLCLSLDHEERKITKPSLPDSQGATLFQEGFVFLLRDLEETLLNFTMSTDSKDGMIDSVNISLRKILIAEEMYLKCDKLLMDDGQAEISFSTRVKFISPPKSSYSLPSGARQLGVAATKLAGSSLKLVGSATKGVGSTSQKVGAAAFRTVGNATSYLGNTSSQAMKSVSPGIFKRKKKKDGEKEESSADEGDSKELLVTNTDEVRTLPSLEPEKVGGSSQDFKRDEQKASSVKSEDGLKRRFSENFSLFRRGGDKS